MKIGHYVSVVAGQKGFERNVSGHVQIPLKAMELLREAGHECHLITNEWGEDRSLPACFPEGSPIHTVVDARRRGGVTTRSGGHTKGVRMRSLWRQFRQIQSIVRREQFDVIHFYGYGRTLMFAGGLRRLGLGAPVVGTIFSAHFPERRMRDRLLYRPLIQSVDRIVTATDYVTRVARAMRYDVKQVKHGAVRDLRAENADAQVDAPHRVLFWRDPSPQNGADLVLEAYERLAPAHPDVSFDLAIRPHWDEVPGIERLAAVHDNVHVHRFPYESEVTLPRLMLESLVVLMPIRTMSIDPQLVIVESMAAGIPVITTDQRSNPELIDHGQTGMLTPVGDADATVEALDSMLADRTSLQRMGVEARRSIDQNWNWDRYVDDIIGVYEGAVTGKRPMAESGHPT